VLQRSVFGGRKYSFRLLLESLVSLAGEFVSVRFVHIFEEWVGAKEQRLLDIRPLSLSGAAPAELERRAYLIRSLGGRHSYWAYRAGCFFPHKDRGPSTGGAGSADRRAAPGKLIVDTRRGLDLGHAPAAAVDDICVAIATTTKALRSIDRAMGENESADKRQERLAAAGISTWSELPKTMELLCWPTGSQSPDVRARNYYCKKAATDWIERVYTRRTSRMIECTCVCLCARAPTPTPTHSGGF
jgi:hypothetical protein